MTQLVWLVTGCSSGLGEAFVHALLARGDRVIATGRKAETRLAHLKETGAAIMDLDVTVPQAELDKKIEDAIAIYGKIDGLINNAGYIELGFIEELSRQQWQDQLNTNLFGSMYVTKALLPHFRERRTGKIAFTSSIFSWISIAAGGPYTVSKHALAGFVQTLNDEVAQFNIQATLFDIGHFRTPVIGKNMKLTHAKIENYNGLWTAIAGMSQTMAGNQPGDPKKGEGMAKGKEVPGRVPIGPDAVQIIKDKAAAMLKMCEEWEELSNSTDFEGPKQGFWAQQEA